MFYQFPITQPMHIHSLDGELREATIINRLGDNDYLAKYGDVKCHAIYNVFTGSFYVDDKYGVINEQNKNRECER
jgi:hypothetical protein